MDIDTARLAGSTDIGTSRSKGPGFNQSSMQYNTVEGANLGSLANSLALDVDNQVMSEGMLSERSHMRESTVMRTQRETNN